MDFKQVEPNDLLFYNNKVEKISSIGIYNHGPYDGATDINLFIISLDKYKWLTKYIMKGIYSIFDGISMRSRLNIKVNLIDEFYLSRNLRQFKREIEKVVVNIRSSKKQGKVILQVIPYRDERPFGYYFYARKIAYSRRAGLKAVPIQTVTYSSLSSVNIRSIERYNRPKGKLRGMMENISIALYSKVGYRPWLIKDSVSDCYKKAIYVGYDISYERKYGNMGMGAIVVFDSFGQIIDYFEAEIVVEEGDKIRSSSFREFIERIIASARTSQKDFEVIIFHRDGDYKPDEIKIIDEYFRREKMKYILLEFPKRGNSTPIFEVRDNNIRVSESGYYTLIGEQFSRGKRYPVYLIQTIGREVPIGIYADALKVRFVKHNIKNPCKNFVDDIMKQIINLSRLNYATKIGVAKLPITVHYSHKAANIKRNGIALGEFERGKVNNPLWMI